MSFHSSLVQRRTAKDFLFTVDSWMKKQAQSRLEVFVTAACMIGGGKGGGRETYITCTDVSYSYMCRKRAAYTKSNPVLCESPSSNGSETNANKHANEHLGFKSKRK